MPSSIEFIAYRREMREQTTEITLNSITEELLRLEKQLKEEENQLSEFVSNNSLIVLEQGENSAAQHLNGLTENKIRLETELGLFKLLDLDANIQRRKQMADRLAFSSALGRPPGEDPTALPLTEYELGKAEESYLNTNQEIQLLQAEKLNLLRDLKPLHPAVIAIDNQIAQKEVALNIHREESMKHLKRRQEGIEVEIQNLEQQIETWRQAAIETGEKVDQHERIKNRLERIRERYSALLKILQEIDVNNNLSTDMLQIMSRAENAIVSRPNPMRPILLGLILGLLAGLIIVVVFDRLDDRMNSFSEFQTHFSEDVLGQIPEQSFRGELGLIKPNDERHLYAEAYRNIRSSILFKDWGGRPPKSIVVTSAVPNEGKTTAAANLAITMALSGARVLLVDGDLRRGGLNEIVGETSSPGLSEVLTGAMEWKDVVRKMEMPNLSFIARGEALEQTSEYLLSQRASDFLKNTSEAFDYVIFDSAPVLVADDTASFAPKADTTVFVVRMSSTMARLAAKALGLLYDRQVNVGGVVLNRASASLKEYSYYNYANYYSVRPTTDAPAESSS